jgi:hypothetical protein
MTARQETTDVRGKTDRRETTDRQEKTTPRAANTSPVEIVRHEATTVRREVTTVHQEAPMCRVATVLPRATARLGATTAPAVTGPRREAIAHPRGVIILLAEIVRPRVETTVHAAMARRRAETIGPAAIVRPGTTVHPAAAVRLRVETTSHGETDLPWVGAGRHGERAVRRRGSARAAASRHGDPNAAISESNGLSASV